MRQKTSAAIFQTFGVNIIVLGISTLTAIFITRLLGPSGKGYITSVTVWATVIGTLACGGIPTAYIYFTRRQYNTKQQLYRRILFWILTGLPLVFIVGVTASQCEKINSCTLLNQKDIIVGASCTIFFAFNMLFVASQSFNSFVSYNSAKLLAASIYLGFSLLFIACFGNDPFFVAWALMAGNGVAAIFLLYCFTKHINQHISHEENKCLSNDKQSFSAYAIKTFGTESLGVISNNFDKMVLLSITDAANVGLYAAAFGLSRLITQIFAPVATVIFPHTAGRSNEQILETVLRAFRVLFLIALVILFFIVPLHRWIVVLAFGPDFKLAASSFLVLSIDSLIASLGWLLAQAFNSLGRPGAIFIRQLLGISVGVVALFFLVPQFGIVGAAAAMLAASCARLALTIGILHTVWGVTFATYIPTKNDVILVASLIFYRMRIKKGN